jgi:hypothetical protein
MQLAAAFQVLSHHLGPHAARSGRRDRLPADLREFLL